jgi:hypothetical protein
VPTASQDRGSENTLVGAAKERLAFRIPAHNEDQTTLLRHGSGACPLPFCRRISVLFVSSCGRRRNELHRLGESVSHLPAIRNAAATSAILTFRAARRGSPLDLARKGLPVSVLTACLLPGGLRAFYAKKT